MENVLHFESCNNCYNDTYRSMEDALHDVAEDEILSLVSKSSFLLNFQETITKHILVKINLECQSRNLKKKTIKCSLAIMERASDDV